MSGDNSDVVPPDSIPNSEVKHVSGDGSVGVPHVRVAHRQTPNSKKGYPHGWPFFIVLKNVNSLATKRKRPGEQVAAPQFGAILHWYVVKVNA